MTQTIKHLVEAKDLLSVVLDCGHCGASLSVPLSRDTFYIPEVCPSCREHWYSRHSEGRNISDTIGFYTGRYGNFDTRLSPTTPKGKASL